MPEAVVPITDAPDSVLAAAAKLVALAREQHGALERGAQEQFGWLLLRRQAVTDRLESMLAEGISVTPSQAESLMSLRSEMIEVDALMKADLKAQLIQMAVHRRKFDRTRKALGSYLSLGPRRKGFLDQSR